ncbi:M23 family metallopeptidase [Saccharibacillus brassicae]|uniref:M23 family metallopeptidase n=1 Tax=Saccharibacillus brassicae TaxID=2583377 RepID=A0A4Y6UYF9_SACBS|nr:M23 family metallopeptidase [Saccharibacillus brassicae]QDH21446.1 M23 family metallopeptidase [Saccharibacillus brassicae]
MIFSAWQKASNPKAGYGQYIRIDHGGGYVTTYGHLSKLIAGVGDTVQAGSAIGERGSTDGSTGPHLHFEIIINGNPVDPLPFVGGK